jgi:hypothetical protein
MGPQREHTEDRVTTVGVCETESPALAALCWPDLTFDRSAVIAMAWPAYCWTFGGELWEFENGAFWVTSRRDRRRLRVHDERLAPAEGWSHPADCDCPSCRVTKR